MQCTLVKEILNNENPKIISPEVEHLNTGKALTLKVTKGTSRHLQMYDIINLSIYGTKPLIRRKHGKDN